MTKYVINSTKILGKLNLNLKFCFMVESRHMVEKENSVSSNGRHTSYHLFNVNSNY